METRFIKFYKFIFTTVFLVVIICCFSFADTIEIRNGMKTTYADKPISLIDTVNKNYSFKWALDKKGNWKLFIRRLNGKLILLSNVWINLERTVYNSNGTKNVVIDYYYFDMNGNMVTGWYVDVNKDIYYLETESKELGRMARGWTKINNDYYYFNDNGVLLKDVITPDGFRVDSYGKWK